MCGIVLINAAGEAIDQVVAEAPIDGLRDWCRALLERRPDAACARLISTDGLLEYAYPEGDLTGLSGHDPSSRSRP
jgi:hypothetical protein